MKKLHFSFKNFKKDKALTIIGIVAGVALPIVTEHINPETLGGSIILILLGSLAGTKKNPIVENVQEAKETAKDYVEQRIKEGKFRNDDYGNEAVNLKKKK